MGCIKTKDHIVISHTLGENPIIRQPYKLNHRLSNESEIFNTITNLSQKLQESQSLHSCLIVMSVSETDGISYDDIIENQVRELTIRGNEYK